MAYKSVAEFKDSVSGILQGLNLNSVKNLNTALERTARQVCVKLDIPEATLRQSLTLYDGVYDYLAPTNIFGTEEIDLRPQGISRSFNNFLYKQPLDQFDREKGWIGTGAKTTFEYDKGTGLLRVVSPIPIPKIELDPMTATTGWTAAGSASALTLDSNIFYHAPSSLRFLLTGASTGTLTKTIPQVDLTDYISVGVVFLAVRIPSATDLTNIIIRIGSDATNYYSVTATTGFLKAFTAGDWQLIAFDLASASTTGTPVVTAIDYAQILIAHTATETNFYVGDLWISLPSPQTFIYQTSAIFLASTATDPLNIITNNNDSILLNDSALSIYELETALTIGSQQGGTLANGLVQQIRADLYGVGNKEGLYDYYRANNPSQQVRTVGSYYDPV